MAESFIEKRKANWQRLEDLLARARGRGGLDRLGRGEVRELGRSYRRAAADLAVARVESRDPRLVNYLNNLVIRAHGLIYRTRSKGARGIFDFYRRDFPAIFRRTAAYPAMVGVIFFALAAGSFVATWRDDDFADFAYVSRELLGEIRARRMWTDELNRQAPFGSAYIIANNLGVGFKTFALSILPVVGTINALLPSALQFGAVNALTIKYGLQGELLGFVAGHGVLEFAAIFIAGGAGLLLGLALLAPGERTRREALVERGALAVRLLAGCIPLLIVAGLIEGFISPLPIHPGYKFAVSGATALALAAYLLRRPPT
jgi:uncharacterized membrane protein SpoIIM required for sporulation